MAQMKLIYPTSLTQLNKFNDGLYPARYPTYKVYQSKQSTSSTSGTGLYKKIDFNLIIRLGSVLNDVDFTINGISYSNSTIINARNIFLKSLDFDLVEQSIYNMFLLNGTLEDFTLSFTSRYDTTNKGITFTLQSKYPGNNIVLTVDNLDALSNTLNTISYSDSFKIDMTLYNIVIGNNISEDVNQYQIGLNVYRLSTNQNYLNGISTTLDSRLVNTDSKSGFTIVDFDISSILKNDIDNFIPVLETFNIRVAKYIEYYQLQAYERYVDNQDDTLNQYANIHFGTPTDTLYSINAYFPKFQNYDNTQYNISGPMAQRNLDLEQNGTSGTNGNVYLANLTRQPIYKKLNEGYELLYNQVLIDKVAYQSNLLDKVYMKFYFNGTNGTETISLDTLEQLNTGSLRYINQFSFKVSNLRNLIVGNYDNVYKIDVNFYNPNYKGATIQTYNTQTYYIDSTVSNCLNTDDILDYTPIVFKNSMGTYDIFEFNVIQELATSRSIQTINTPYTYLSNEYSEFQKIYNIDYNKFYTTKTNILTQDVFTWLEDLLTTDKVFIIVEGNLFPIILTGIDYNSKINQDLIISITFKYSKPY